MSDNRKQRSTGVPPVSSNTCGHLSVAALTQSEDTRPPFHFLNPFENVEKYCYNLPHWQQGEAWQFVTWRLADAMPQEKLVLWEEEKNTWIKLHPHPWDEATEREYHERFSHRVDKWLDAGHGSCLLHVPLCAHAVADALRHFNNQRYRLGAFVVMPNHVHILFQPIAGHPLKNIIHTWKSFTAKQLNRITGQTGALWQKDYWDRLIRHEAHWYACQNYILENPAKLSQGSYVLERGMGVPQ